MEGSGPAGRSDSHGSLAAMFALWSAHPDGRAVTVMVDLKSLPPDLQQRYGYKPHARWLLIAVLVVAVVLAVGIGWLAWVLANPPVTYKLLTWDAADDHIRVTWGTQTSGGHGQLRAACYRHQAPRRGLRGRVTPGGR